MKKFLLATVALVALGATVPALAADLGARPYTKAPAYAAPIYNWTGFYIGGHVGGAFGGNDGFAGTTNNSNDGRFLGGLQAGADYQFAPNWVAGVEGQYSWLRCNTGTDRCRHRASSTPTTSAASARSPAGSATPGVRRCSTSRAAMPTRLQ